MKAGGSGFIYKWLLCAVFLAFLFIPPVSADVGNGVSHNDPPSSSYEGSSGGSEISMQDLIFLLYLFRDYPVLAIIIVIAFFVLKKFGKVKFTAGTRRTAGRQTAAARPAAQPVRKAGEPDIAALKQKDPQFSDEVFLSKVNNMFIQLQEAWMNKEWPSIRPFETDQLFSMHNKQLESYVRQHRTNVVENIAILDSYIARYENDGEHDELDVFLRVRMNDYVIDDHTGKVLKGKPDRDVYMAYIWTLIRKDTVKTDRSKSGYAVTQCPNCGAGVSINASGQCEYCDSVISSGEYDWVLSKIKVVSQS